MHAMRWKGRLLRLLSLAIVCLASACASPSLTVYTLAPSAAGAGRTAVRRDAVVIEVRRAALPDYLDSQEITVRDGNVLRRSTQGRWATRLSVEATRYVTGLLAQRRPDALVTDQAQTESPAYRLLLTINTLDVTAAGEATLDADWQIVSRNPARPTRREHVRLSTNGPVATDQAVVALNEVLLRRLAESIKLVELK